jgi:hypothetical protein
MGGHDSRNPSTETLDILSTAQAAKNSAKIVRMRVCLARCASLLSIGWTLPDPTVFGWKIATVRSGRIFAGHPRRNAAAAQILTRRRRAPLQSTPPYHPDL